MRKNRTIKLSREGSYSGPNDTVNHAEGVYEILLREPIRVYCIDAISSDIRHSVQYM